MANIDNKLNISSILDPGIKRKNIPNQDYLRIVKPVWFTSIPPLLILADGMGGYDGGAIASRLVVETIAKEYIRPHIKRPEPLLFLRKAIYKAHQAVTAYAHKNKQVENMGSTVLAAIVEDEQIYLANVGDSRAYLVDDETIVQLSWDHSLVADLVRNGQLTWEEARRHPKRNVLSLSISAKRETIEPYVTQTEFRQEQSLILCSDGVWSAVTDSQLQTIVMELHPDAAVKKIMAMANMNQGPDNISAFVVKHPGSNAMG